MFDPEVDWDNNDSVNIIKSLSDSEKEILRNNICDTLTDIKMELLEGTLKINAAT